MTVVVTALSVALSAALAFQWRRAHLLAAKLHQRDEELRRMRGLHDMLLQSVHGLVLHFDVAAEQLAEADPVRRMLKVTLQRADQLLTEERKRM